MSTPYVMRPSKLEDLPALMELAELSGPGFTSLPVDESILEKRLSKSEKAFAGRLDRIEYGKYLLMMEDADTGEEKRLGLWLTLPAQLLVLFIALALLDPRIRLEGRATK